MQACRIFLILGSILLFDSIKSNKTLSFSNFESEKCGCEEILMKELQTFKEKYNKIIESETEPSKYEVIHMDQIGGRKCPTKRMEVFLEIFEMIATHNKNRVSKLEYIYETDMTLNNSRMKMAYATQVTSAILKISEIAKTVELSSDASPEIKRQMKALQKSCGKLNNSHRRRKLQMILGHLVNTYGHAKACPVSMECLSTGEIAVEDFFASNRDYDSLQDVWTAWRDATGPILKDNYTELVKRLNMEARENGFPDSGYFEWFGDMDNKNFNTQIVEIYNEILPLYKEIHAYVRYKLLEKYPNRFTADGPIPAHILGNVWAQKFTNYDVFLPFPNTSFPNVTSKLEALRSEKNLTRTDIVAFAEDFFHSIGLPNMTEYFWKRSTFKEPKGKVMQCHASAHDFFDSKDFRIKMCMRFSDEDFQTIHHEMGHIQYFMAYAKQPILYRNGANTAFHEAIGDTIQLSAMTPEHFRTIKLIEDVPTSEEFDINYLMRVALEKVAFIPFGLTVDTWRWNVFNGSITPDTYNKEWWNLRSKLQGIMPPVPRTKKDVDALAKYHIAANIGYIRYFSSFIMQFQFYEALCKRSGYTGPLHRCDFYKKTIGTEFQEMLSLGASKPWPEAMKLITGQPDILAKSILEYFRPLHQWLKNENKRLGNYIGWKSQRLPVE